MRAFVLASLLLASLLLASTAQAGSIVAELRGDMDSVTYNEAAGKPTDNSFLFQTGRFDFKGDINESLSYRMRLKINDESVTTGADKVSSRFDIGFLAHKMDKLTLTLGKFGVDAGGLETSSDAMNIYYQSEANKALTRVYSAATANNAFFQPIKYSTGAKLAYKDAGQELAFMVFNNPTTEAFNVTAPASPNQTRFFGGVVFKGSLMESKLQPILSHHYGKSTFDTASATTYTGEGTAGYSALGLKWNDEAWWAQVDYVDLKSVELNVADLTKMSVQSTILEFGYNMDAWTFRPKIELSEVKTTPSTAAETKTKYQGLALAAEYRPFADLKGFRYHGAVSQKTTKIENVDDAIESHVLVGFAYSVDLLK